MVNGIIIYHNVYCSEVIANQMESTLKTLLYILKRHFDGQDSHVVEGPHKHVVWRLQDTNV